MAATSVFAANTNDLNTSALGASLSSFVAQGPFQCRKCPLASDGQPMAPTQDRMRCLPCLVDQTDPETTAGYSDRWGDCVCPEGSALKERTSNGSYQLRKTCVKCAEGILFQSYVRTTPQLRLQSVSGLSANVSAGIHGPVHLQAGYDK